MTPTVLAVDDSSDDLALLRLACDTAQVCFDFRSVQSGEEALSYLLSPPLGSHEPSAHPDLLLLDLKLTGISGFEVLSWLRGQPKFDALPVIILTASIHPEDRARALALGADAFVVKSVHFDDLQLLVQSLNRLLQTPRPRDLRSFSPLQQSAFITL